MKTKIFSQSPNAHPISVTPRARPALRATALATLSAALMFATTSCEKPASADSNKSAQSSAQDVEPLDSKKAEPASAQPAEKKPPKKSAPATARAPAPGKQPATEKSANDAEDEAIEFHNALYGYLGAANKPLERITKIFREAVGDAQRDHNADRTQWSSLSNYLGDMPKIPKYKLPVPDAFSSGDKEFFDHGIVTVRDSVTEILAILDSLSKYYDAEDYKDDWYKKLYMDADRVAELAATIKKNRAPLEDRVDEITDEIDARHVATIPVGRYVLNMRGFVKKYRALAACLTQEEIDGPIYDAYVPEERLAARAKIAREAADKAEALCAELDELADTQKPLVVADYAGSRYEKIYQQFYKKYEKSKTTTKRVLRDLREKNWTSDTNNIIGDRNDIGRQLGEFVGLWNDKGSKGK